MKTAHLFKEYIWLVSTIHRAGRITFDALSHAWQKTKMSGGLAMPRSTSSRAVPPSRYSPPSGSPRPWRNCTSKPPGDTSKKRCSPLFCWGVDSLTQPTEPQYIDDRHPTMGVSVALLEWYHTEPWENFLCPIDLLQACDRKNLFVRFEKSLCPIWKIS